MKKQTIIFQLNGEPAELYADPASSLLDILREELGLLGTKAGCGRGECGACTVLIDDLAVNSCIVPVGKVQGRRIETIEGLSRGKDIDPIQETFVEKGAVQCGFCTPGMIMSAHALLKTNPQPSLQEIKTAISGNLCRCTGYKQIEEAILSAAENMNNKSRR